MMLLLITKYLKEILDFLNVSMLYMAKTLIRASKRWIKKDFLLTRA